jgi:ketosteroid isomerase-like protein
VTSAKTDVACAPDPGDKAFFDAFADRWLAAWNSHDTDEVLDLLHDDVVWEDPYWSEVIRGVEGVGEYTNRIWQALPDVQFDVIERFLAPAGGRGGILLRQYWSGSAELTTTADFDSHVCDIFVEFRKGKLAHYVASYDIVSMLLQQGRPS